MRVSMNWCRVSEVEHSTSRYRKRAPSSSSPGCSSRGTKRKLGNCWTRSLPSFPGYGSIQNLPSRAPLRLARLRSGCERDDQGPPRFAPINRSPPRRKPLRSGRQFMMSLSACSSKPSKDHRCVWRSAVMARSCRARMESSSSRAAGPASGSPMTGLVVHWTCCDASRPSESSTPRTRSREAESRVSPSSCLT